jgi:hypothetical protein
VFRSEATEAGDGAHTSTGNHYDWDDITWTPLAALLVVPRAEYILMEEIHLSSEDEKVSRKLEDIHK